MHTHKPKYLSCLALLEIIAGRLEINDVWKLIEQVQILQFSRTYLKLRNLIKVNAL